MSLATRIESLVIRVAQEFNDVRAKAGNLANLTTTDKSNLVAAINELKAAVVSSAVIDDAHIAAIPVSLGARLARKSLSCSLPAFSGHAPVLLWRTHVSMKPRLATFRLASLATSAFIRTRLNKKEFPYDDTRKPRNRRRAPRATALPADGEPLGALGSIL